MPAACPWSFYRIQTWQRTTRLNNTFLTAVYTFTTQTIVIFGPDFAISVNDIATLALVRANRTAFWIQLLFYFTIAWFRAFVFLTFHNSHITYAFGALIRFPFGLVFIKRSTIVASIVARILEYNSKISPFNTRNMDRNFDILSFLNK